MNLDELLQLAVNKKASDLHLTVGHYPTLRIDGKLVEQKKFMILTRKEVENLATGFLSPEQKNTFINKRELDYSHQIPSGERFRINLHYEKNNPGLVARVIPKKIPSMEEITMPRITYNLTKLHQGFILVTGPTGCGKSTTLASMIELINQERKENIITLEDPIEFIFQPKQSIIKQRQLSTDMLSFQEGLKHIVRQDPNVIMVGEMRDLETIATTITLAETGHLVFTTLHTNSAAQTIDRIIDIFPPHQQNQIRTQLANTLAAVISQRLLPKIDGGRIAAREILINNPAIANLIRENKIPQIKTVIQTSKKQGMISMENSIKELYRKGLISKETAESYLNPYIV